MKVVKHVSFWIFIIILLTFIFGRSYENYAMSFYFVSMLIPVIIGTSYFFNYLLVPKYLFTKKYFTFSLYCIYLLIVSLNLEMMVITAALIILAEYDYANMNPITTNVFILTITLYFVVLAVAFIRLVRFYFKGEGALEKMESELKKTTVAFLIVKENRKNKKVALESIAYIESLGDYVKIVSDHAEAVETKEKISHLADRLPQNFMRIHRSFIVNKNKISTFSKESLFVNEVELPISRSYKEAVHESLSK